MWIKDSFVVLFALFVVANTQNNDTTVPVETTMPTTMGPTTMPSTMGPTTMPSTMGPTTISSTSEPDTSVTTGAMTTGSTAGPPTPPPITDVGTWQVNQTDSPNWCIKLTMGTTFNVTYYTSTEVKYSTITLFSNASSSGDCGKEVQYIKLDMGGDLMLDLNFTMSGSNVQTKMVQLTYNVGDQAQFPGSNATNPTMETATTTKAQWSVPKGNSYTCMEHNEKIDLDTMVSMMPVNLTVQAFNDAAGSSFGSSQYCAAEAPPPNNIVPIVVGAALAGLVVIVLIAYLIGRKRNKRGYESV